MTVPEAITSVRDTDCTRKCDDSKDLGVGCRRRSSDKFNKFLKFQEGHRAALAKDETLVSIYLNSI